MKIYGNKENISMNNLDVLFDNFCSRGVMSLEENKALNELETVIDVNNDDIMNVIIAYVAEAQRTAFNESFKMAYNMLNELEESEALTYKGSLSRAEVEEIEHLHSLTKAMDINDIIDDKVILKVIELCLHDGDVPMLNAIEIYNLGVIRGRQLDNK